MTFLFERRDHCPFSLLANFFQAREDNVITYDGLFRGKTILVTGGTGSFGNQVVSTLLRSCHPKKIIIFSRDEKKQVDMQREYGPTAQLEFIIGDVRNYASIKDAMRGVDIACHAAALKQVPHCEDNPFEAVQTNIQGAQNVRRAAEANRLEAVVALSTDKAVKPVNVMGMTKALQERIFLNRHRSNSRTRFVCVRYGNVLGSRGSVVPFFKDLLVLKKPLPVTHPEMTRFLLTLREAVDLVFEATINSKGSELFVQKMPACYIMDLARAMSRAFTGREDYPIEIVGIRPGEKIHEVLVSEEEMNRAVETETHYVIYPDSQLEKPRLLRDIREYTSNNTEMVRENKIIALLTAERWLPE